MSAFGNERQQSYANSLAKRMGYQDYVAAVAFLTNNQAAVVARTTYSTAQASDLISALENAVGVSRPDRTTGGDGNRPRYLTARSLRRIACFQESMPSELDEDARWVLGSLAKLRSLENLVMRSKPATALAVNGHDPITTAHLVEFFGTRAEAAAAFGISEKTFDGWGALVPAAHVWRAEVMTGGYVVVPKGAVG